MNHEQLDERQRADLSHKMRVRYVTLQQEASAALRDTGDPQHAALADQVHDLQEQAFADVLEDVRLADVRRALEEMRDIEQALARMHAGTFGQCTDCGKSIALARLGAYPTAKRCLSCQEIYERRLGKTRPPRL
jgi:RNA polymerase-binding transcription factor